jgi:hypothetical protein
MFLVALKQQALLRKLKYEILTYYPVLCVLNALTLHHIRGQNKTANTFFL